MVGIHGYLEEFSAEARAGGLRTVGDAPGCPAGGGDGGGGSLGGAAGGGAAGDDECLWEGVNYTFDGRCSDPLAGAHGRAGRCCYCGGDWHSLCAEVVCRVCCDQILVCPGCRAECHREAAAGAAGKDDLEQQPPQQPPQQPGAGPEPVGLGAGAEPEAGGREGRGGVNFEKRLRAEAASVYLCTEHSLQADQWRGFLGRVERAGLERPSLENALAALRAQLEASKVKAASKRAGRGRRKTLTVQIERLELWLQERTAEESAAAGAAGGCAHSAVGRTEPRESERQLEDEGTLEEAGRGGDKDTAVPAPHASEAKWAGFFPLLNLFSY